MTLSPSSWVTANRNVLLALGRQVGKPGWCNDIDVAFRPCGFVVCWAHSCVETVERVEQGGLAAAVLVGDDRQIDGLSLLRIIRSIDAVLPCWLVTRDTTRHTLQEAFALKATGVITHPVGADELGLTLRRRLAGPVSENESWS